MKGKGVNSERSTPKFPCQGLWDGEARKKKKDREGWEEEATKRGSCRGVSIGPRGEGPDGSGKKIRLTPRSQKGADKGLIYVVHRLARRIPFDMVRKAEGI